MKTNLDTQLARVHAHAITFTEFALLTRKDFEAYAAYLMRAWIPPAWVTLEDTVQELHLAAHQYIWKFDKTRGVSLRKFVVYNAINGAKRAIHRWRGASLTGTADKNPSRFERAVSTLGRKADSGDALIAALVADVPMAEQALIEVEERRAAIKEALDVAETPHERIALIVIAEAGDIEEGGRMLYRDFDARIALRLGSEEQATKYVMRHAKTIAKKLDAASAS